MIWITIGSLFGFLAVLLGAFAAHGLKQSLDAYSLGVFQTGVTYQMYHALALFGVGLLSLQTKQRLKGTAVCFVVGILLFSGSLYVLALSGQRFWGAIAPFGGVSFMIGWGWLFLSGCSTVCRSGTSGSP